MTDLPWVADKIEMRDVADLVPYARNSRVHSPESVAQLAAGMREWGWTIPCLVDEDDGLIAGHGRILAAHKLKLAKVPVIVARGWSEEKKRAYVIWDNRSSELSTFDDAILRVELGELQAGGFDLSLTGFSSGDLSKLFATEDGRTDPDDVPAAPEIPVSRLGDLWVMGEHRLACADCTDRAAVESLFEGRRPNLLICDPPYGISYDATFRSRVLKDGAKRAEGAVRNDDRADWREAWALFPGDVAYVWHADKCASLVEASLGACGFEIRNQIIWNKSRHVLGRGHYHSKHEPCFYAVRKGGHGNWQGSRKETTVWEIDHVKSDTGHSTQKPVEAMARPMRNNSAPGDVIYDPFMGSGTSLVAAHANKRIALGCEIEPRYIDISLLRWQAFSGMQATLAKTGETFVEVRDRRHAEAQDEAQIVL